MAALAAVSAVATFLVLSQLHSVDAAKAAHAAPPAASHPMAAVATTKTALAPTPEEADIGARTTPPPAKEAPSSPPDALRTEPPAPAKQADPEAASPRLRSKHAVALIAGDDASLQEMLSDPKTIPQLIHDGRLFSAKPGTKVEILERQHNLVHVRLLEGSTADRSGWVSRSEVSNPARR